MSDLWEYVGQVREMKKDSTNKKYEQVETKYDLIYETNNIDKYGRLVTRTLPDLGLSLKYTENNHSIMIYKNDNAIKLTDLWNKEFICVCNRQTRSKWYLDWLR